MTKPPHILQAASRRPSSVLIYQVNPPGALGPHHSTAPVWQGQLPGLALCKRCMCHCSAATIMAISDPLLLASSYFRASTGWPALLLQPHDVCEQHEDKKPPPPPLSSPPSENPGQEPLLVCVGPPVCLEKCWHCRKAHVRYSGLSRGGKGDRASGSLTYQTCSIGGQCLYNLASIGVPGKIIGLIGVNNHWQHLPRHYGCCFGLKRSLNL